MLNRAARVAVLPLATVPAVQVVVVGVERAETTASARTVPLARITTGLVSLVATAGRVATTTAGQAVKAAVPIVPLATRAATGPCSGPAMVRAAAAVAAQVATAATQAATVLPAVNGELVVAVEVEAVVLGRLAVLLLPGAMV
jgi:hypothetical protein